MLEFVRNDELWSFFVNQEIEMKSCSCGVVIAAQKARAVPHAEASEARAGPAAVVSKEAQGVGTKAG